MTTQDQNLADAGEQLAEIDAEMAEKLKALQPSPTTLAHLKRWRQQSSALWI